MSRIIKSPHMDESSVSEFLFKPISHVAPQGGSGQLETSFIPMTLFDGSELRHQEAVPQIEESELLETPRLSLTEEEMNQQLNESFEKGLVEGKNLAERGLLNVFRSLRIAAEEVRSLRLKVMRESEDELLRLVMLVARKVILREVVQDRSILSNVVEAGISAIPERDEITIRLNPDDYILVTTGHEQHLRKDLLSDRMQLKSDPTIQPGFCLIDSEMGTLDASIDAQLDEIYRRLLEERASSLSTDS
ncbi:FliH/SctL family protein [Pelotalea chapellei]|uniref:Flagellar assembly protein FliH n=1 Tax=Pelotalea chapellei TaxID=44671 RepID=A0ABS5U8F8_9BACT|nr:FliH/SctL family protein [Pelotalea chapellei]MBT1071950.1 hypothetical protein [Pelotalea chapellei]